MDLTFVCIGLIIIGMVILGISNFLIPYPEDIIGMIIGGAITLSGILLSLKIKYANEQPNKKEVNQE